MRHEMNYQHLVSAIQRFGADDRDICQFGLGIPQESVHENVILAPWWQPSTLLGLGEATYLSASDFSPVRVWNIHHQRLDMTFIRTGIGAPVLMDALLSLGVTRCKRVIFVGSVGSLDTRIGIGDIVIPEYSVCGNGASRYLSSDNLSNDPFGERSFPDAQLNRLLTETSAQVCKQYDVRWHTARVFSIDTIFAQFAHIDAILDMGCNVIEMETAAAFRAAAMMQISLVALFCVSDNTITHKSLVSGRSAEENEYRTFVRRELFPKIILSVFQESAAASRR